MLKQFKQERSPPDVQLLKPNSFIFAGFTNLPFHVNKKLLKYPCNITPSWDNTPFDTLGCLCLPLHKHTGNSISNTFAICLSEYGANLQLLYTFFKFQNFYYIAILIY